jgi:hypothetical protein
MLSYWSNWNAFPDITSLSAFIRFVVHAPYFFITLDIFRKPDVFCILLAVLLGTGLFWAMQKKDFRLLLLTLCPLLIHLAISSLKMYPFFPRFYLYLYPLFFILSAYGVSASVNAIKNIGVRQKAMSYCTVLIPLVALCSLLAFFPSRHQKIRDSIAYIASNKQVDDIIYCHWETIFEYQYYEATGIIERSENVIQGTFHCSEEKFANFSGRVWLLFAKDVFNQKECIFQKLDSLNFSKIDKYNTFNSSVVLFRK